MKRLNTLRTRFALWLSVLILVCLAAFGIFVYYSLSRSLYTAVDDALMQNAEQVLTRLRQGGNNLELNTRVNLPDLAEFSALTQRGSTLLLLAQNGAVLHAVGPFSRDPPEVAALSAQAKLETIPEAAEIDRIRVYTLPILAADQVTGWVQTMQSLGSVEESLDRLRTFLIVGGTVLSVSAGLIGHTLAGRALAPIDDITRTARRISTEDLSARLNLPDTGDEVSRLANTFDEMLERIESGFVRERRFTADASHELRTPLTAIQTILSLLGEGEWSVQEYRQAFDDLAEEATRLQTLVEELLQLARSERGYELHAEDVDLAPLLTDVADSLRLLAENKHLALTCDLPEPLVVRGDSDQLIRVFINLLSNAIQYTDRGAITLSAREEPEYIVISVADTGAGIPPEHLPHVFERFYRIETARTSAGVGLGLSIARQIVLGHGGRLEVHSEVDHGATFNVYLPR